MFYTHYVSYIPNILFHYILGIGTFGNGIIIQLPNVSVNDIYTLIQFAMKEM